MANERKESGISPTMSEVDTLVEELVEREQYEKDQRDSERQVHEVQKERGGRGNEVKGTRVTGRNRQEKERQGR